MRKQYTRRASVEKKKEWYKKSGLQLSFQRLFDDGGKPLGPSLAINAARTTSFS